MGDANAPFVAHLCDFDQIAHMNFRLWRAFQARASRRVPLCCCCCCYCSYLVITADGVTPNTVLDLSFTSIDLVVDGLEGLPSHFLVNPLGLGRRGTGVVLVFAGMVRPPEWRYTW